MSPRDEETTKAKRLGGATSGYTSPALKCYENVAENGPKTVVKKSRGLHSLDRSQGKINSLRNRNYNAAASVMHPESLRKSQKDVSLRLCANGSIELTQNGQVVSNETASCMFGGKSSFQREHRPSLQGRLMDIKD